MFVGGQCIASLVPKPLRDLWERQWSEGGLRWQIDDGDDEAVVVTKPTCYTVHRRRDSHPRVGAVSLSEVWDADGHI
jgi:hypothetical protein